MNGDNVLLFVLALFGALTLVLSHRGEVLAKMSEIIRAGHEVRRSLRKSADDAP